MRASLNPIEKFWRRVRQDVFYLHRDAADWQTLQDHLLLAWEWQGKYSG